ncbi:hypothetical protein CBER1_11349 [Cercospora berteroae]|uniref:Uncharacterized protein n=1 Tax=Cercospora berteroae TaxID=357750 RepID=A0A2S6BZ35_9PEZI|nr:hypothetical protein CBER1_11349 [Cercospora berteroae]
MFSNLYDRLVQWPDRRRYCPLQDQIQLASRPSSITGRRRNASSDASKSRTRGKARNVDGYAFLSLLEQLNELITEYDELLIQIRKNDRERHDACFYHDLCQVEIEKLQQSENDDVLNHVEERREIQETQARRKSAADSAKDDLVIHSSQLQQEIEQLWQKVHAGSQAYNDACFESHFDQDWCVDDVMAYVDAIKCAQIHHILQQNRRGISKQRVNKIILKSQIRLTSAAPANVSEALPLTTRHELRQIREQRFDDAVEALEFRVRELEDLTSLQESHLKIRRERLMRNQYRPALQQKGLLQQGGSICGSELPGDFDEMLEQHDALLEELEHLQEEAAETTLNIRSSTPEYFLAFTNLTTERLEAFIAHSLKTTNEEAARIERRIPSIRQALQDRGVAVPTATVSTSHQRPIGGGLGTPPVQDPLQNELDHVRRFNVDRSRSRKLERRRLNDHRLDASQAQDHSANSAATPPADVDLMGLGSAPVADRPAQSPQSEQRARRKLMLRDYKATQGRSDDDVDNVRKRQRTESVIEDQAQEDIVEAETIMSTGRVTRARTKRDNTRLVGGIE